jgi:hypothetical protein
MKNSILVNNFNKKRFFFNKLLYLDKKNLIFKGHKRSIKNIFFIFINFLKFYKVIKIKAFLKKKAFLLTKILNGKISILKSFFFFKFKKLFLLFFKQCYKLKKRKSKNFFYKVNSFYIKYKSLLKKEFLIRIYFIAFFKIKLNLKEIKINININFLFKIGFKFISRGFYSFMNIRLISFVYKSLSFFFKFRFSSLLESYFDFFNFLLYNKRSFIFANPLLLNFVQTFFN